MSDSKRYSVVSSLKLLVSTAVAILLFMAPSTSRAEPLLLLYNPLPDGVQKPARPTSDLGFNEKGDLVIKYGDVELAVTHTPTDSTNNSREWHGIAPRQENSPAIGISFKISLLF